MNTRSSTRSDPSKASSSADGPAEPTHSEVHVERPQDLASPVNAPPTDAPHADAPHDDAPSNSTPCDNPPHATVSSTSHSRDRAARLNAMIAAAADKAFTLACEEEQLDDSPASQERKNRILAEIERLNKKRHELKRLMEQPAADPPEAAPAPVHPTPPSKPARIPQFTPDVPRRRQPHSGTGEIPASVQTSPRGPGLRRGTAVVSLLDPLSLRR